MELSKGVGGFGSSKKQKGPAMDPVDRLSDLPDSILVHILSFLPTRDAARTILIRRFGNLWTLIHNLDFDRCMYHECIGHSYNNGPVYEKRFINLIRHVLILHERANIHRFRLSYDFCLWYSDEFYDNLHNIDRLREKELRLTNEIDTWIRCALRKNVRVLELDFRACGFFELESYHKLHNCVLSSGSLIELKLICCCLELKAQVANLRFLKTLSLVRVVVSDDTMLRVLSGCPVLENLFLIQCYGLRLLDFTSVYLKNVTVCLGRDERTKLEISCPYVASLDTSGWIERVHLNSVPSLIDATLDFNINFTCASVEYHEVRMLLEKLKQTKVFTMKNRCILVLTIWELKNLACPSSNWKQLFLNTQLTKWHLPGIASLLRNSPNLEMLDIYVQCDDIPFTFGDNSWFKEYELDQDYLWNLQQQYFNCLTSHVKTIRLSGYVKKPQAIEFVQFLLKTTAVLEKMLISTKKYAQTNQENLSGRGDGCLEELLTFPRASDRATISIL